MDATLIALSLVPFALTGTVAPQVPATARLDMRRLYAISPLRVIGCFATGVTNGAFWGLAPVFAQGIGLSVADISIFMSSVIFGGMAMQLQVGVTEIVHAPRNADSLEQHIDAAICRRARKSARAASSPLIIKETAGGTPRANLTRGDHGERLVVI